MQDLVAERLRVVKRFLNANEDLEERVRSLLICASYDPEEDLFTLTLGEVQPAITESIRNHIYLRLDPPSMKLVGIEIPDLTTRIFDDPLVKTIWHSTQALLGPAEGGKGTPEPEFKWAQELRELVSQD